jgi:hypothetical protein
MQAMRTGTATQHRLTSLHRGFRGTGLGLRRLHNPRHLPLWLPVCQSRSSLCHQYLRRKHLQAQRPPLEHGLLAIYSAKLVAEI